MTTEMQTTGGEARDLARMVESLVMKGDISALPPEERVRYYIQNCETLGLNPHSQPFAFLRLNGKEVMYATRGATDQLAAMHRINREIIDGPKIVDIAGQKVAYCVAKGTHPNGRTETATATLPVSDPANLYMKLETKAKRRVTLSILGLGLLDETEIDNIPASAKAPGMVVDVTVTRDDGPAENAAPDRFAAFVADLAAADDLGAVRAVYDTYADALGGTSAKPITDAVVARLAACGYHLTAVEAKALIGGTLDAALALAYDRLAAVARHVDDEDGHGVVADVVRVLRGCGALPKAAKTRLLKVAALTVAALLEVDADTAAARLDAALRPPTPPSGGPDAPRTSPTADATADATGSANDAAPTAGAKASARPTPASTEAELVAYLARKGSRTEIANAVRAHGPHLMGTRFEALAAARAQAVCVDADGATLSEWSAELLVRQWREEGVSRRRREAEAAAAVKVAA